MAQYFTSAHNISSHCQEMITLRLKVKCNIKFMCKRKHFMINSLKYIVYLKLNIIEIDANVYIRYNHNNYNSKLI